MHASLTVVTHPARRAITALLAARRCAHLVLRPVAVHGRWAGFAPAPADGEPAPRGDEPSATLIHGLVKPHRLLRFVRVNARAGAQLAAALVALLAAAPLGAQAARPASPTRTIALTFDDLPVVSLARDSATHTVTTERLVGALRAGGVPAIGFVNDDQLRDASGAVVPWRRRLLERWLDAGLELGNHTAAHPDLHRTPLAEYQQDVLRGERTLRPLLAARGAAPRWFRHPFLRTGRSVEERRSLDRFLAAHGYRVAPVTVDDYDYVFARAYDRALGAGDDGHARRVADAYLAYMDTVVGYWEAQTQALLGRPIPHVLLLHANRLNADALPRLLAMLRGRGYAFVPIERAVSDPAYASVDAYVGPAGMSWVHRWAITAGRRGAAFAGEPEVPAWIAREP